MNETKDTKLQFRRDGNKTIQVFSDADWANDSSDRKSIRKLLQTSRRINILVQQKADYCCYRNIPGSHCFLLQRSYMVWKQLLEEIDNDTVRDPIVIRYDNQSAISFEKDFNLTQRSKHIDVRLHFVKDYIEKGYISVTYISTDEMIADVLTKALYATKHFYCTKEMGLLSKDV